MNSQHIQSQLLQVLSTLPEVGQKELFDFALFLRQRELAQQQFQEWDAISDEWQQR